MDGSQVRGYDGNHRLHHRWVVFTERQKKPARARRAPRVPSTSQRGRLMAAEAHRTELRPRWATSFRLFRIDLNEGRVMATKKTAKSAAKPAEHRAAKTAVSRSKLAAVGRTKALPRKIASAKASPNTLTKVRKQAARKGQSPTARNRRVTTAQPAVRASVPRSRLPNTRLSPVKLPGLDNAIKELEKMLSSATTLATGKRRTKILIDSNALIAINQVISALSSTPNSILIEEQSDIAVSYTHLTLPT